MTVKNNIAQVEDPLRIDRLLASKILDEEQHNFGLQLIALWMIANRHLCGAMNFGEERKGFKHASVPDMPDRIVAATGIHLGVPFISRDGRIRASSINTIW